MQSTENFEQNTPTLNITLVALISPILLYPDIICIGNKVILLYTCDFIINIMIKSYEWGDVNESHLLQ